ncbi:endonuclease/exonuclease/phosphatase family protein [Noviherbaspirillum galbum]|nr:endonuclease/exonuclease/phosphatase family protein [Noviherbaspirillum galbum]
MKVATLNLRHGGGTRVVALAARLAALDCDVLVLTEFRCNRHGQWLEQTLAHSGYHHFMAIVAPEKTNTVAIASRLPFTFDDTVCQGMELRSRLLPVAIGSLRLVGAYFPQGRHKRPVFDWLLHEGLAWMGDDGIVLGDLNTGLHGIDEAGHTFAETARFRQLGTGPLVDAWRTRHGDARQFSWYSNHGNGFRIDHLFCTQRRYDLLQAIAYDHAPRLSGESDHAALIAMFHSTT